MKLKMTTKQFEAWLVRTIDAARRGADGAPIRRVETFKEGNVATGDPGLLVRFEDGSEIQLTLVRLGTARLGRHEEENG